MRTLLMLVVASVALSFYGALHYWMGRRLIGPLRGASRRQRILWLGIAMVAVLSILGMTVGRLTPRTPWVASVQWVGFLAMGWMTVTVGMIVVRDLLLGVYTLVQRFTTPTPLHDDAEQQQAFASRRRFLRNAASLAVVGASSSLSANGVRSARETAALKYVEIPIRDLDPALQGFKIVQLSDIHVGDTIRRDYFQRIVDRTMTVGADLIVITGDLVDGRVADLKDDVAPIRQLAAPQGVFFITGNHEYYSGPLEWIEHLRSIGIDVLLDEHRVLTHKGANIVLGGITDHSASRIVKEHTADPKKAFAGAPQGPLRILLAHQPRSYPRAQGLGVHLQLSGHTHGGQIWPFGLLVPFQQRFIAGLHKVWGSMWIYISRGTGYWGPPMRVASPSEITVITLRGS